MPSPEGIMLRFPEDFKDNEYKLIELNDDVLKAIASHEGSVNIVGHADDEAVLCTEDATYTVKFADTSNTMLFLPASIQQRLSSPESAAGNATCDICGRLSEYIELRPTEPRIERVRSMLREGMYCGPEEEDTTGKKYTMTELLVAVQASESELRTALNKLGAVRHEGLLRLLHPSYIVQVMGLVLATATEQGWPISSLSVTALARELVEHNVPAFAIRKCLSLYGEPAGELMEIDAAMRASEEDDVFTLPLESVCRFRAEELFKLHPRWRFPDFMESWSTKSPDGIIPTADLLKGLAIVEGTGEQAIILHFPVRDLPTEPQARFDRLFAAKPKWEHNEIAPYLQDIVHSKQPMDGLLLRYTRCSSEKNARMYNARY